MCGLGHHDKFCDFSPSCLGFQFSPLMKTFQSMEQTRSLQQKILNTTQLSTFIWFQTPSRSIEGDQAKPSRATDGSASPGKAGNCSTVQSPLPLTSVLHLQTNPRNPHNQRRSRVARYLALKIAHSLTSGNTLPPKTIFIICDSQFAVATSRQSWVG